MLRTALAAFATAAALAAPAAHAGGVQWSIGINVPLPVAVVSGGGYYVQPAPVYVEPAPVRYAPAPQYLPAPVYEAPRTSYYAPPVVYGQPVVYEAPYPAWRGGDRARWEQHRAYEARARWEREHREHHRHDDERRW